MGSKPGADGLLNEIEAARVLGLSVATLRNYRWLGRGLAYLELGRAVRYALEDLEEWVQHIEAIPGVASDEGFIAAREGPA
jgi:predicted DNA-binding transcriptional regulator AlpA